MGAYKKLIEFYKAGEVSFKYVKTFNMDEYCGMYESWTYSSSILEASFTHNYHTRQYQYWGLITSTCISIVHTFKDEPFCVLFKLPVLLCYGNVKTDSNYKCKINKLSTSFLIKQLNAGW